MDENGIGKEIVDAAIAVHRELGPGLLETVYECRTRTPARTLESLNLFTVIP